MKKQKIRYGTEIYHLIARASLMDIANEQIPSPGGLAGVFCTLFRPPRRGLCMTLTQRLGLDRRKQRHMIYNLN